MEFIHTKVVLREVQSPQEFTLPNTDAKKRYLIATGETISGTELTFQVRDKNIDDFLSHKIGSEVDVTIKVSSHRNHKTPDVWYHKLVLVRIGS
jgi:uncharacterized OB-fold protein